MKPVPTSTDQARSRAGAAGLSPILIAMSLLGAATQASASTQTYAGNLGDSHNTALVYSDLSAAEFDDADDIANNVALYALTITGGFVTIDSTGFAAGGVDPYFTLFSGSGPTATFLASNFDQAFGTGGDFDYSGTLASGKYEIALGAFANESFAENYGDLTLADGFIGFGSSDSLGDGGYALTVTVNAPPPVPEPSPWVLSVAGLAALAFVGRATRTRQDARRA